MDVYGVVDISEHHALQFDTTANYNRNNKVKRRQNLQQSCCVGLGLDPRSVQSCLESKVLDAMFKDGLLFNSMEVDDQAPAPKEQIQASSETSSGWISGLLVGIPSCLMVTSNCSATSTPGHSSKSSYCYNTVSNRELNKQPKFF